MKQDKDWTDVMRSALQDAEVTPPADGWARLERELKAPSPRVSLLRTYWPRVAAAAAAVLILVGVGGFLLHENRNMGDNGFVIASATDGGSASADSLAKNETGALDALEESIRSVVPSPQEILSTTLPVPESKTRPALLAVNEQLTPIDGIAPVAARGLDQSSDSIVTNEQTVSGADQPTHVVSDQPMQVAVDEPGSVADNTSSAEKTTGKYIDDGPDARTRAAVKSGTPTSASGNSSNIEDERTYTPPTRRSASMSMFAAGGVTGTNTAGGSKSSAMMLLETPDVGDANTISLLKYDYSQHSFRHHQPLSFGLSARKEFAHGLSLESGVIYTLLRSDVRVGDSKKDISQKLHFIGVPLRMNWQFFETKGFSLYVGAGGMVEKCVSAKFGTQSVDEKGVQWSVFGAAGAQYSFNKLVGLYFEPEISYYFNDTELQTSRTDSPLTFTLRLGVRLSF